MLRLFNLPVLLGVLLVLSGCGPDRLPEQEFVQRLRDAFPETENGRGSELNREQLIELIGQPDRSEKIGGKTEKWVYRFPDRVMTIRFVFLDSPDDPAGEMGFSSFISRIDRN